MDPVQERHAQIREETNESRLAQDCKKRCSRSAGLQNAVISRKSWLSHCFTVLCICILTGSSALRIAFPCLALALVSWGSWRVICALREAFSEGIAKGWTI